MKKNLVSTLGNVEKKVDGVCILMFGCKGLTDVCETNAFRLQIQRNKNAS